MSQFNNKGTKLYLRKGATLVELIVATVLMAVISLAIWSIIIFSRFQVENASIRARVHNAASLAMDHMSRNIGRAIGNTDPNTNIPPIDTGNIAGHTAIKFWVDDPNPNGRQDAGDTVMAYRWRPNGGDAYELQFCPQCQGPNPFTMCNQCNPNWNVAEVIATNIEYFGDPAAPGPPVINGNNISIEIRACHDATAACGTVDNPRVTLRARILMPSVSTQ